MKNAKSLGTAISFGPRIMNMHSKVVDLGKLCSENENIYSLLRGALVDQSALAVGVNHDITISNASYCR